ncbi:MAG: GNAT family N-acetyltransferase [Abitibacteriaceae bacterium]|nr:GNAT family N-acetyltransferase [Abditibacteriaceae bacterium]
MEITRRPTQEADTDFAREAHHRAYHDVSIQQFGPWDERAQDRYFQTGWTAAVHEIVLCDGAPCGYACIEERPHDMHVRELVIHPDFQNRGIGSAVLRQVMARAQERQVPVRLGTFVKNRALHLYQRLGFEEFDRTEVHILLQWVPKAK